MKPESRADTPMQDSESTGSRIVQPLFTPLLVLTVPLVSLFFGIAFVVFGVVINAEMGSLSEAGLGLSLILGVLFLIIAFVSRQTVKNLPLPHASTCLALFVLFEFIAGSYTALVVMANAVVDHQEVSSVFYVLSVFGLVLVADSLLFYHRNFKKTPNS